MLGTVHLRILRVCDMYVICECDVCVSMGVCMCVFVMCIYVKEKETETEKERICSHVLGHLACIEIR